MSTLAARDQENLIHAHHTVAAAKPLNQGVRGLAPKTPGNNGRNRNRGGEDENVVRGGKTGKSEKLSFVTPVARDRAPLGAKTTNFKAKAFQTPGPLTGGQGLQQTQQRRSASARKPKLKIHQPEIAESEPLLKAEDEEEPEIEYCPPKIIPLPDYPDDDPLEFGPNHHFPQFERENMSRGWPSQYAVPVSKEDIAKRERRAAEHDARMEALLERSIQDSNESAKLELSLGDLQPAKLNDKSATTRKIPMLARNSPDAAKAPSTLTSRSAAAALSAKTLPRFAAPTTATNAKKSSLAPAAPAPRHTPGTTASHTTIGYSAGRRISSMKQREESNGSPSRKISANQTQSEETILAGLLSTEDEEENDLGAMLFPKRHWLQEMAEGEFKLEMPVFDT